MKARFPVTCHRAAACEHGQDQARGDEDLQDGQSAQLKKFSDVPDAHVVVSAFLDELQKIHGFCLFNQGIV